MFRTASRNTGNQNGIGKVLTGSRRRKRKFAPLHRNNQLVAETLEERCLLVVGATEVSPIVAPGTGFDGVVAVDTLEASSATELSSTCTGSLLRSGRHILTAAHCLDTDRDGQLDVEGFNVVFQMPERNFIFASDTNSGNVKVAPDFDGKTENGADLAVVELSAIAPFPAERYDIHRQPNEVGGLYALVGYGRTGIGRLGTGGDLGRNHSGAIKRIGENEFSSVETLTNGPLLLSDFDDGGATGNFLGDTVGLNNSESNASAGDSGAPAFLWDLSQGSLTVAGVMSLSRDTSGGGRDTFGDVDGLTPTFAFRSFIDGVVNEPGDIVLDMNLQPRGNDGVADQLTARRNEDDRDLFELLIDDIVVWSAAASTVDSMTIIGSSDDDVLIVSGDLDYDFRFVGGGADSGNQIVVASDTSTDDMQITPLSAGAGVVSGIGFAMAYEQVTKIDANLQFGQGDTFRLLGSRGDDTIQFISDETLGSGSIVGTYNVGDSGFTIPDIRFRDAEGSGPGDVRFAGAEGDDSVRVLGSSTHDRFDIVRQADAVRIIQTVNQSPWIRYSHDVSVESIAIDAQSGDDIFDVSSESSSNRTVLTLDGNNPSVVGDRLFYHAFDDIAVSISDQSILDGPTNVATTTNYVAVESIELDLGQVFDLTIRGTDNDDTVEVRPMGEAAANVALVGHPNIVGTGIGELAIDTLAGDDTIAVNAGSADEAIFVLDAQVNIVGKQSVELRRHESLIVRGGPGHDQITVTASATVPIFVDGNDPIGDLSEVGDTLNVDTAGNASDASVGPENDEGNVSVEGRRTVSFDHIEGLSINGTPHEFSNVTEVPLRPTIDLVGPDVINPDILGREPIGTDTGMSGLDNVTRGFEPDEAGKNTNLQLAVTAEPGSLVRIRDGAAIVDSFVMPPIPEASIVTYVFRSLSVVEGPHIYSVEVLNPAEQRVIQSEDLIVTVDFTVPPFDTVEMELVRASDSGATGDLKTNKMQPAFVGLAEPNAKIRLFARGELVGQGVVNSDESNTRLGDAFGTWEITTEPLVDGMYRFTAELEDLAGNISRGSIARNLMIDTLPPQRPTIDLVGPDESREDVLGTAPINSDSGMSGRDNVTQGVSVNGDIGLQVRVTAEPGSAVVIKSGEDVIDQFVMPSPAEGDPAGFVYRTILVDLGTVLLSAEATDMAGNRSAQSNEIVAFVDRTGPDTESLTVTLLDASNTGDLGDQTTSKMQPAFGGVAAANTKIRLLANGEIVGQGVVNSDASDGVLGDGLGAWEITVEPLADGEYQIDIELEDGAGNVVRVDDSGLIVTVDATGPQRPTIDLVGPDVVGPDTLGTEIIISDTGMSTIDNKTRGFEPDPESQLTTLQFAVDAEAGERVVIKDGVTVVDSFVMPDAGGPLYRVLSVDEGSHLYSVETFDSAGNRSDQSTELVVLADFTAPVFDNVTIDLLRASETGDIGDLVTSKMQPAFSGLAEPGAAIRLFANGELVGQGIVNSDESNTLLNDQQGTWEVTVGPLADGTYRVVAEVEDMAGNISRGFEFVNVIVDTLAPQRPTLDLVGPETVGNDSLGVSPIDSDSGMSSTDDITNGLQRDPLAGTADIQLRVSSEPGSMVVIKDGEDVIDRFVMPPTNDNGVVGFVFRNLTLTEGPHSLSVETFDLASNRSVQSAETLVIIDTVAPGGGDVTVSLLDASNTGDSGDLITSKMQPAFSGLAEAGAKIRILANGEIVGQGVVNSDASDGVVGDRLGTWEITVEPLADGDYTIQIDVEDMAGNVARGSTTVTITVDAQSPQRPTIDLVGPDVVSPDVNGTQPIDSDSGMSGHDNVTRGNRVDPTNDFTTAQFAVTADAGSMVQIKNGNVIIDSFVMPAPNSATGVAYIFRQLEFSEGAHPLSVETFDAAANRSAQSEELLVSIDYSAPAFDQSTLDLLDVANSGTRDDLITNKMQPVFGGLAESNAKVRLFAGIDLIGQGVANSDESNTLLEDDLGTWEITVEPLVDGTYRISMDVEDLAGNISRSSTTLNVTVDTLPPQRATLDLVGVDVISNDVNGNSPVPSDTGMSTNDDVTRGSDRDLAARTATVQVAVSAEPGADVAIKDGEDVIDRFIMPTPAGGVAPVGRAFRTLTLSEGTHLLSTEAFDVATNRSSQSEQVALIVDVTAPESADITLEMLDSSNSGVTTDLVTNKMQPAFSGLAEANSKVRVLANGRIVGQGIVNSDESDGVIANGLGTWEITVEPLVNGDYSIELEVEDLAGNISRAESSLNIIVDGLAPQRPTVDLVGPDLVDSDVLGIEPIRSDTGMSGSDNVTRGFEPSPNTDSSSLQLAVTAEAETIVMVKDGEDVIDRFVMTAEGGDVVGRMFRRIDLDEGTHLISVEAFDAASNRSAQSHELPITVDFTPPIAEAITVRLLDASNSGNADDLITNKMQPAFSGLAEANSKVRLFANGELVGQGIVNSDESDGDESNGLGTWEVTVEPLADGTYTLVVDVEDLAGNISRSTSSLSLIIDALAPQRPTLDLIGPDVTSADVLGIAPVNSDTGMSGLDNVTRGFARDSTNLTADLQVGITAESGSAVLIKDGEDVIDRFVMPVPAVGEPIGVVYRGLTLGDGPHLLSVEAFDPAFNRSHQSEQLVVTVDTQAPEQTVPPDMVDSSDSGFDANDNVTMVQAPAFSGVAENGTKMRMFATDVVSGATSFVGMGTVSSDESDRDDGLNRSGIWEITVEPLRDGVYNIATEVEDLAGNMSPVSPPLRIEIDTVDPNTPVLDLVEADDSGRHDDDNVTNINTPRFSATSSDTIPGGHQFSDNLQFRIYLRAEEVPEVLIYDSLDTLGGLTESTALVTTDDGTTSGNSILGALADGLHNLKLEVEDRAGNMSHDFLLDVLIDSQAFLGQGQLHADSDTGVWGYPETMRDGITADMTPTFTGTAEADNIVTVLVDGAPAGTAVAIPLDGNDAFQPPNSPNEQTLGNWEVTVPIALEQGAHSVVFVFEDLAGNRAETSDVALRLFVDASGPHITNVTLSDLATSGVFTLNENIISVFEPKPSGGPDPIISSISVHLADTIIQQSEFLTDVVLPEKASEEGNYLLVGDVVGPIPILEAIPTFTTVAGQVATAQVELVFHDSFDGFLFNGNDLGAPLPDDRYTLTVLESITDPAGNPLDGESGARAPFLGNNFPLETPPVFPTGDGEHGGEFVARFTVDSRPEVGVWAAGSEWVDTNGNERFDPAGFDFSNRDVVYKMGFTSDDIFSGNFVTGTDDVADGFDKLGAYGRVDANFRWLIDVDNDGVADIARTDPANVNGLPVAGEFDGQFANGEEVGIFTGRTWYFDTNHDYLVDVSLPSQLVGYPVVGDFDRDGFDDLATWADDRFQVDLANGSLRGWDGTIDVAFTFGFIGVRERPVADDIDQDGFDDLGIWVPDREGIVEREHAEWYLILSNGSSILDRISADPIRGNPVIEYAPHPFGPDRFVQFGDDFALPLLGNFDPPTVPTRTTRNTSESTSPNEFSPGLPESDANTLATSATRTEIGSSPSTNIFDVNSDRITSPLDALLVINAIGEELSAPSNLDVNGDGIVSPLDALLVINSIIEDGDEPFAASSPSSPSMEAALSKTDRKEPAELVGPSRISSPSIRSTGLLADSIELIASDVAKNSSAASHLRHALRDQHSD